MSVQKYHAFEKSSVQLRHTIKRLEVFSEVTRDLQEKEIAEKLLKGFKELKSMIPEQYQDVDIRNKDE